MRITIQEAAELLSVSEKTLYRWIGKGLLPVYRMQDQYRFNRAELLAWAISRKINVSEDSFHNALRVTGPVPTLVEAIKQGGVIYQLEGKTKEEVLHNLVQATRFEAQFDREYLYSLLLARESLGPTGVGEGLAIPQLIYPNLLDEGPPAVCIAFLETPVDFDSLDDAPVDCLLALFSPHLRPYYFLLNRLYYCLRDEQLVQALRSRAGRDELTGHFHRIESVLRKSELK